MQTEEEEEDEQSYKQTPTDSQGYKALVTSFS